MEARMAAADAGKPAPIEALTGIRGLAAWWIVGYHFREALPADTPRAVLAWLSSGYLAVDLFFELSGFVIALNYASWFQARPVSRLRQFLGLRLARIYPLHAVMLGCFLLEPVLIRCCSAQGHPGDRYDPGYFLLSLGLMQNWGLTDGPKWNIPAWSISTEWFAYLMFPGLAWLTLRVARDACRASTLAIILLLVLAVLAYWLGHGLGGDIAYFGLPRCVLEFWIGICVACVYRHRPDGASPGRHAAILGAGLCFASCAWLRVPDFAAVPAGCALLIHDLARPASILGRILSSRALIRLGVLSYATYIVHFFVKDMVKFGLDRPGIPSSVTFVAYVVLTASLSVALHRLVEVPGRQAIRVALAGKRLRIA